MGGCWLIEGRWEWWAHRGECREEKRPLEVKQRRNYLHKERKMKGANGEDRKNREVRKWMRGIFFFF